MQKVKCPHCKKNIELSEVAKEQAKHLAAQEIKQLKAQNQDDKIKFKKELEGKYAKDREKDAETIKELKASRKQDAESIAAVERANAEKKINKEKAAGEQREAELKLKLERVQKDLKKATQKSEQGLTADQGATQHNFLGSLGLYHLVF